MRYGGRAWGVAQAKGLDYFCTHVVLRPPMHPLSGVDRHALWRSQDDTYMWENEAADPAARRQKVELFN